MKRFFADMNPLVRGLLIVAAIALVVMVLQLYATLAALYAIARIAFFIAIAFFLFLMWRERRSDIELWPARAQFAFYGAAILAVVALGVYFTVGASGPDAAAFLLVLAICGFSMFRVWRDQHTSY
jgi:small-conductance mechanosensitive channel